MRDWVRQFARFADEDDLYDDDEIDRAAQLILNDFARTTKCLRAISSLAITAGSTAVGSFPANFTTERLMRIWIPAMGRIKPVDIGTLVDLETRPNVVACDRFFPPPGSQPTATGIPTYFAFDTTTTGVVWPTPDANYTAKIQWWQPAISWTVGSDDGTVLNFPDDYLQPCLTFGVPAALQHNEEEHEYAKLSMEKYEKFRDAMRDAGNLGGQASGRSMFL